MINIIGIDEAGRGPLAGPVSIGVVMVSEIFSKKIRKIFPKLRDSKKLSEKRREEIFEQIKELQKERKLNWSVSLISEKIIDKKGISFAIKKGIQQSLKNVGATPHNSKIFLDGGIYAPEEFKNQRTIIKGDEKIPVISLASICAKVIRDKKLVLLSKKYLNYEFEIHKGYGTKSHIEKIRKHGLSEIHRRSFCKKITSRS